jgi:hypothetical protein
MLLYRTERLDAGIPMPVALASMPMPSYANLQQKGDGLGVSQNTIGRLLISSPPSKRTVKQEKVFFFCTFLLFKILDEFFMGIAVF